jgi:hypothetical protein
MGDETDTTACQRFLSGRCAQVLGVPACSKDNPDTGQVKECCSCGPHRHILLISCPFHLGIVKFHIIQLYDIPGVLGALGS